MNMQQQLLGIAYLGGIMTVLTIMLGFAFVEDLILSPSFITGLLLIVTIIMGDRTYEMLSMLYKITIKDAKPKTNPQGRKK